MTRIWNNEISEKYQFPHNQKLANVTPALKKEDKNLVKNFRPASVLPVISKTFERKLLKQTVSCIDKYISICLFGYREGCSTQHASISMIEKWQKKYL